MQRSPRSSAWRRVGTATAVLALATSLLAAPGFSASGSAFQISDEDAARITADKEAAQYIVRLADAPVSAYDGSTKGFKATKPAEGAKVDVTSANAKRYAAHLRSKQDAALAKVGAAADAKVYSYTTVFNGVAAILTGPQASALRRVDGVLKVERDILKQPTTDASSEFLGLTSPGGLRDTESGPGLDGEDVIVGVIDTGAWPEHPSFSDQADLADRPGASGTATSVYGAPPAGWNGTCQSGEQWSQDDCNGKLIGARYFLRGFGHFGIVTHDFKSPRDADGHGSHTASTAAGNAGVSASMFGVDRGTVSGMAPRARIAVYKVCWNDEGCSGADLVAAIDAAVADGVDVINYSIGSDTPAILTADTVAFLFAADAGVYVATSNGNAGPGPSTTGSPASVPWVTSVGASTHDRTFEGTAILGDGSVVAGASVTGGTAVVGLVDAEDAGDVLCNPGALDPAVVRGKIVLCQRGAIARVAKSLAVQQAGGVGMILFNTIAAQELVTDNHYVPSIHTGPAIGAQVKQYIDDAGAAATAQLTAGVATATQGSVVAAFSSRGPNGADGDIIKPDVTAPGVNILAAGTPTPFLGAPGQLFQAISGTSMSSPHVAGLGALLTQAHPDWSPAAIKSALMTTARQDVTKEDATTQADPFDMGAGHVNPNPANDPGLVYDAGFGDYLGYLCAAGEIGCATPGDTSDLNLASIGVAALAGSQTVTRTVTNVGPAGTYTVDISDAPAGVTVDVDPTSLTLATGESDSYEVTFTTEEGADIGSWTYGSLTWTDGTRDVRSVIAVKPVQLAFPASVGVDGGAGSTSWDVGFGYTGTFGLGVRGLVPAVAETGRVVDDPANDIGTALDTGVGITVHEVTIPAGTAHARFSLFDAETDGADDLDLYVFGDAGLVGGSGSGTSAEQVDVIAPAAGQYFVVVHGWQTDGPDSNYTLSSWLVPDADLGNTTVTGPASATLGAAGTITATWTLTEAARYLGAVAYADAGGIFGSTILAVDNRAAAAAPAATAPDQSSKGKGGAGKR